MTIPMMLMSHRHCMLTRLPFSEGDAHEVLPRGFCPWIVHGQTWDVSHVSDPPFLILRRGFS